MSGVGITGLIKPLNGGSFPVWEDTDGYGGYRSEANAAARDAIPDNFRKIGLCVFLQDTGETWQLIGGITNGDWVPFGAALPPLSNVIWVDAGTTTSSPDGSIAAPYPTLTAALAAAVGLESSSVAIVLTPGGYSGEDPIELPTKNLIFWGLGTNISGVSAQTALPPLICVAAQGLSFRSCTLATITDNSIEGAQIDLQYCNCQGIVGNGNTSVVACGIAGAAVTGILSEFSNLARLALNGCSYLSAFSATIVHSLTLVDSVWASATTGALGSGSSIVAYSSQFSAGDFVGFSTMNFDAESLASFQTSQCTNDVATLIGISSRALFDAGHASIVSIDLGLNGSLQRVTLDGPTAITIVPGVQGVSYLELVQGAGGSHLPTFTGVVWADGTPPTFSTAAGKIDVVWLLNDGTRVLASTGLLLGFS